MSHRQTPQPNTMDLLRSGAEQLGVPLSDQQLNLFERYYRELVEWNKRFNLTAITDYDAVQTKHFLDSLAGIPLLMDELTAGKLAGPGLRLVDVGTGAGLPGIPLRIALPTIQLALMDGTGKKIRFLTQVSRSLGLDAVDIIQGRAEELGRQEQHRARFDIATARAVAPLNTLVEYLLPLVRLHGMALIYKGPGAPQEFIAARKAIQRLGGETVRLAPVHVPYIDGKRFILLIQKVQPTPDLYPRGQGLPRRQPIQ